MAAAALKDAWAHETEAALLRRFSVRHKIIADAYEDPTRRVKHTMHEEATLYIVQHLELRRELMALEKSSPDYAQQRAHIYRRVAQWVLQTEDMFARIVRSAQVIESQ